MYSNKTKEGLLSIRTLDLGCPLFSQSLIVFNPINRNILLTLVESFEVQVFMTGTTKNLFSFLSTNTNFCNITT